MKVKVDEVVQIAGAFEKSFTMLNVGIELSFTIPPATFSPGMKMIVEGELNKAITRLLEKASRLK